MYYRTMKKDFERIDDLELEITKLWNVVIPIMKGYRDSLDDAINIIKVLVEREEREDEEDE